ncbi:helix-turn-helix domain-containing protein [Nocardia fluminea]|uniref:helix-turn-helix domain-containing protein n=1 Tax=Nocardia fluminea TaxID=134984 RepID=UPI00365E11BF
MATSIAAIMAAELRGQRGRRRLTQAQLAALSGVSYRAVVRLENAQRSATVEQLLALADALDVPATALLPDLGVDPSTRSKGAA